MKADMVGVSAPEEASGRACSAREEGAVPWSAANSPITSLNSVRADAAMSPLPLVSDAHHRNRIYGFAGQR